MLHWDQFHPSHLVELALELGRGDEDVVLEQPHRAGRRRIAAAATQMHVVAFTHCLLFELTRQHFERMPHLFAALADKQAKTNLMHCYVCPHLLLVSLSLSMLSALSLMAAGLMSTPTTWPCLPASIAAQAAMNPQPQPTSSTLQQ